jgi:hypothetical protein
VVWEHMTEYYDARTMMLFKEEYLNEGRKEGEEKLSLLLQKLLAQGRVKMLSVPLLIRNTGNVCTRNTVLTI